MSDLPSQLQAALADRYRLERELGRGGMAVVYLAHDIKHDRRVALKVVQPDVAQGVKTERFLREIQIAAKLSHPLILPLYDSGEVDGVPYYVMPYVEGESLRDRLNRENQMAVEDALRITRDVASALGEAHDHSVVHRDIKPENILLTKSGHALVVDFGIARALTAAGSGAGTEAGAVGTPAYMAPEQASGRGEVDRRSDIYSLGCVLYEMLAGRPPYAGDTAQEILARHALDPVPRIRTARPGVLQSVERAVAKALAKIPADRFATAAQFASALAGPRRRAPVYVAVIMVLLVGSGLVARRTLLRASEQSVAVLPFVNMSGDTGSEYFSDGMSEELINALVQVNGLRVPARTSAFAFKGKSVAIRDIGHQLNVANVVEGSVRRTGNRVHVSAQLINVADGFNRWSQTYDRELRLTDVIAIQSEIARAIVSALQVKLAHGQESTLVRPQTQDLEAYDLYLRGRYFFNRRSREDIAKAIDYFRRAIAQDSGYAVAYSGLADAYIIDGNFNYAPPAQVFPKADSAARKALLLDESLAEAHTSLARLREERDRDVGGAEQEFRRAIVLNPRYALAHSWFGLMLTKIRERWGEAVREGQEAQRLDPLSPAINNNLGAIFSRSGRHNEAIAYFKSAAELQPDWDLASSNLLRAYRLVGRYKEGLEAYERLRGLLAERPGGLAAVGEMYALTGNSAEAVRILEQLLRMPRTPEVWRALGVLHARLGDKDRAFEELERARQAGPRGQLFMWILTSPEFDPLRSDPRFVAFVKKLRPGP